MKDLNDSHSLMDAAKLSFKRKKIVAMNHIDRPGSAATVTEAGASWPRRYQARTFPAWIAFPPAATDMARGLSSARNARRKRWPDAVVFGFSCPHPSARGIEIKSGPNRTTRGNIYIMASGESASGKSETFRHVARPFFDLETEHELERWKDGAPPDLQADARIQLGK